VLVLFGLQLPELFLVLASGGVLGAFIAATRSGVERRRRAIYLAVALAAVLPIMVTVATRPAVYNGIRHFVFVLPPLAVAGGLAANFIIDHLKSYGRAAQAAAVVVFLAALVVPVIETVRLHPYQYAYFNSLADGVRGARERYMLDYWGLSFKQAGQQLRDTLAARNEARPAGRKWKIAVCGPHPPASVALGPQFEPTWDPKGADFALMLGEFYCAQLDAPVLTEVVRDGVVFARAYDIRGREVANLFTLPPVERD
jgi:hypothetical protein